MENSPYPGLLKKVHNFFGIGKPLVTLRTGIAVDSALNFKKGRGVLTLRLLFG
jgi:hypothetical protein